MIVDTHVHVASPDIERFPRQPTGVGSDWWKRGGAIDSLVTTLDANHVDRAVVVQAVGVYGFDCRCAAAAVAAYPSRLALVGAVDMDAADPADLLQTLAGTTPLAGVRLFGVGGGEPRWLADGRGDAVCDLCAELAIPIVPTLFPGDLRQLADLVARHGDVRVALDHCGFVDPSQPTVAETALAPLAEIPTVVLKVTSHVLHAAADGGDPSHVVDILAGAFGADRLCWGSDFPQHQGLPYPEMLDLARRATRHLSPADRDRFFATTCDRMFRRDPASLDDRAAGHPPDGAGQ